MIGFLGLGTMGFPIARRLAQAGFTLSAYDPGNDKAASLNASPSDRPPTQAEIIITCLPDEHAVESTYLTGDTPLQSHAHPGTITIDHSTCSPDLARRINNALHDRGITHIEAPLFGGVHHANTGQLFLALSGRDESCALPNTQVAKIAATIAREWRWVGAPGTAMTCKILQNGLGLVQLAAMGEVAAACRRLQIDPHLFYNFVNDAGGMAATPLFRERFPRMLTTPPLDARLAIGAKDAELFLRLLQPSALSLADPTARIFSAATTAGLAEDDITAVCQVF